MHPIERLRHVARAQGAGPSLLGREAAGALAGFVSDPQGLVTACRRLVDRHPRAATVWWLAARVLAAGDPGGEAYRAASDLDDDPTPGALIAVLPDGARVLIVGWPELTAEALRRRPDVEALIVDAGGDGSALAHRLDRAGLDVVDIPDSGVAAAVADPDTDLVVLEADALGPDAFLAAAGSRAAAAVARDGGKPVWVVVGVGRVLPARLWTALLTRLDAEDDEAWDREVEVVPLALADQVVGPTGVAEPSTAPRRADCPVAPELLRPVG